MILGIVGSERIKFTARGERDARALIRSLLAARGVTAVVSGKCHLGGIDIWAAEIGRALGLEVIEFPPKTQAWASGYKPRNLQIAAASDEVHCITVDALPDAYPGMRFPSCYHCGTTEHVKSGGCWTARAARRAGRQGVIHVVRNAE